MLVSATTGYQHAIASRDSQPHIGPVGYRSMMQRQLQMLSCNRSNYQVIHGVAQMTLRMSPGCRTSFRLGDVTHDPAVKIQGWRNIASDVAIRGGAYRLMPRRRTNLPAGLSFSMSAALSHMTDSNVEFHGPEQWAFLRQRW
ncbi:hypothetical protein LA080_008231 [Diaporthe eres]|nr:hypothetical protein LA080_008231 [Diaporthe eres]